MISGECIFALGECVCIYIYMCCCGHFWEPLGGSAAILNTIRYRGSKNSCKSNVTMSARYFLC